MSLDKYINLLTEEIIGNLATVYHRGSKDKLNRLLNKTYVNLSHIDFNKYNKALYTTTDMASQLNQGNHQFNNMKEVYGDYIIKLVFKGVSNCWFCDYDEYRKFNNCTIDNWKEQQFKKFNIAKEEQNELAGYDKKHTENHAKISKYFERKRFLGKRVKGIQYNGKGDGNCLLIYDWSTAVPIAVSNNEGKTWEKVDKSKTSFSRSNFNKNDYIDTISKSTNNFLVDENGNIDCSEKELTSLQRAPKEVGGGFNCSSNKLTSLQGAPRVVNGAFICDNNKLTSLQGAPKRVGYNFSCSYNKLTSLQGAPIILNGAFMCDNNKLTSLQGAPRVVNGDFDCRENELTSLQGAPRVVNGDFNCSSNKLLSKEEILKYLKTAKIRGEIFTDYWHWSASRSQKEAIEKLSGINEEIFNY